jgi:hypothetical protein
MSQLRSADEEIGQRSIIPDKAGQDKSARPTPERAIVTRRSAWRGSGRPGCNRHRERSCGWLEEFGAAIADGRDLRAASMCNKTGPGDGYLL